MELPKSNTENNDYGISVSCVDNEDGSADVSITMPKFLLEYYASIGIIHQLEQEVASILAANEENSKN